MKLGYLTSRTARKGQSIVEFALVLPLLLLFFVGMAEVGFGMFNYIRIAGANREGARMASRGRFEDETVAHQVVAGGGLHEVAPGVTEPNLRTSGTDANTGIIITHIDIPVEAGGDIQTSYYVSGTLTTVGPDGPEIRWITPEDGLIQTMSHDELLNYLNHRRSVSGEIYAYRSAEDFETLAVESYVIVETYYAHETVTDYLPFLGNFIELSFKSTLRVLEDSRLD